MLRSSVSDASSTDLHRYLAMGQVNGFQEDRQAHNLPISTGLSTRAQLNLRPADVPIPNGSGGKIMLRAHSADARHWRPQTVGSALTSKSRPADVFRGKDRASKAAAAADARPKSAVAPNYFDKAEILAAMKQDRKLWERVHSPGPAAAGGERNRTAAAAATSRQPPQLESAQAILQPPFSCSNQVDVSISTPPRATVSPMKKTETSLLSPSPAASRKLQSPSSCGLAVKATPEPLPPNQSTHGGLISFLSLEHKRQQQHSTLQGKEDASQQLHMQQPVPHLHLGAAGEKVNSPSYGRGLQMSAASSPVKSTKSSANPAKLLAQSTSTHVSGNPALSPGASAAGLQRLVLEYAKQHFACF
jgi:hypothetical protein